LTDGKTVVSIRPGSMKLVDPTPKTVNTSQTTAASSQPSTIEEEEEEH
jgi:hypothetical protein